MKPKTKKPNFKQPHPQAYIVQANDVTSEEMYRYPDEREEPVLRGITFDIRIGECWGIIDNEPFELELLMQIIGNVRPYASGRCSLTEQGMMRRKRRILPHVFFISGGDTVPGNLNTLEYLMYVTAHRRIPDRKRQATILKALLDSGLYYLTLVPMKQLTMAERAAICLLSAAMSKALLIVFSVSELSFPPQLAKGIRYVVELIHRRGGAVLIGSKDCFFVQTVCTHAAFMLGGEFRKSGRVDVMLKTLDQRAFILTSEKPELLEMAINKAAPNLQTYRFDNEVHIYVRNGETISQAELMHILLNAGVTLDTIQTSRPTLQNAYKEVLAGHVI